MFGSDPPGLFYPTLRQRSSPSKAVRLPVTTSQESSSVVQSLSVVLGYLKNDKANTETFLEDTDGNGRRMRTGDEAVFRQAPSGNEHLFIVDRIKELIKVKVGFSEFRG
jgi:acyl-CoA synthetase (AMP-forming)/AMP-acid ligase II